MTITERARREPRGRPTAEGLIRTAERLFAIHGLDGVSLRQIALEEGHKNPGAVQYHFGTKERLLKSIINYRLPWVNRRRTQLLELLDMQQRSYDLWGLVEVLARPYLEMDPDSFYVQLLARLSPMEDLLRTLYESGGEDASGSVSLGDRLNIALAFLPPVIRANRVRMARSLMHNTIAARRAIMSSGDQPVMRDDVFAQELFEALYAVLTVQHQVPWPDRLQPLDLIQGL